MHSDLGQCLAARLVFQQGLRYWPWKTGAGFSQHTEVAKHGQVSLFLWLIRYRTVIYPLVNKHSYGKSAFLMGKSATNSHFNSYVSLPEGNWPSRSQMVSASKKKQQKKRGNGKGASKLLPSPASSPSRCSISRPLLALENLRWTTRLWQRARAALVLCLQSSQWW